ncbi:hypothetical protein MHU86_9116 [Fragilaria crotonensis]|nr:hypothetical protein MHU86_9116 [Fragilaria crotonensis]
MNYHLLIKSAFLTAVFLLVVLQASADDHYRRLLRGGVGDQTPVAVEQDSKQDLGQTAEPPDHQDTIFADDPIRELGRKGWRKIPPTTGSPQTPEPPMTTKPKDAGTRDLTSTDDPSRELGRRGWRKAPPDSPETPEPPMTTKPKDAGTRE